MVYFANGGSPYLHAQTDMNVDSLAIDWKVSMSRARQIVGPKTVLTGNVDPILLYTKKQNIEDAVKNCIHQAGGKHVLNLGHGVEKDTQEEAVATFVNACTSIKL